MAFFHELIKTSCPVEKSAVVTVARSNAILGEFGRPISCPDQRIVVGQELRLAPKTGDGERGTRLETTIEFPIKGNLCFAASSDGKRKH